MSRPVKSYTRRSRTIWLQDGVVALDGATGEVLDAYRATVEAAARADVPASGPVRIMKAEVSGADGGMPETHRPLDLRLRIESDARRTVRLFVGLTEAVPSPIFVVERYFDRLQKCPMAPGCSTVMVLSRSR